MGPYIFSLAPGVHLSIRNFLDYLNCSALPGFGAGLCSPHVYAALLHAGATAQQMGPLKSGKDFGIVMGRLGCAAVSTSLDSPQAGDVAVIQATSRNPSGHVQVWTGSYWISDWKQTNVSAP